MPSLFVRKIFIRPGDGRFTKARNSFYLTLNFFYERSFVNSTSFYVVLHFLGCKISIKFSLELTRIDLSSREVFVKIFNIAEQALIAAKVIRITQISTKAQLIILIIMFRTNSSIN